MLIISVFIGISGKLAWFASYYKLEKLFLLRSKCCILRFLLFDKEGFAGGEASSALVSIGIGLSALLSIDLLLF